MIWQDAVLAAGNFGFALALVPTAIGRSKPPLATSAPTALTLFVFAATFVSLGLWVAATSSLLVGSLWAVIGVQRWGQRCKEAVQMAEERRG